MRRDAIFHFAELFASAAIYSNVRIERLVVCQLNE